jgi:WD40 repeat protein
MNDVGGCFFKQMAFAAILNFDNKLRIYDVRGTHRRPVQDIPLATAPRSKMTKLTIDEKNEHYLYVGNDVGEVYQLDSRQGYKASGKFKGITTSITGLSVTADQLFTSSLDCYVRIFDLEDKSMVKKYYLNKPITSLFIEPVESTAKQEVADFGEEEENLSEEEIETKPKVKFIRKRNKVGLKYLEPREFDTP